MRRIPVMLLVAIIVVLVGSFAYAAEVVIDDWYTMNYRQDPETAFCVWEPVMYVVDYTITGKGYKIYKAIIVITSMGDRLREVEKHKPGTYTTVFTSLPREDDVGEDISVEYRVKLKGGGEDIRNSIISVSDCSAQ
jgi:hypothetical protein